MGGVLAPPCLPRQGACGARALEVLALAYRTHSTLDLTLATLRPVARSVVLSLSVRCGCCDRAGQAPGYDPGQLKLAQAESNAADYHKRAPCGVPTGRAMMRMRTDQGDGDDDDDGNSGGGAQAESSAADYHKRAPCGVPTGRAMMRVRTDQGDGDDDDADGAA